MKITGVAMMMTVFWSSAWAGAGSARMAPVVVCVGGINNNIYVVGPAEEIASKIFFKIGVRVNWRGLNNCPTQAIQIELSESAAASDRPGALAYAHPFDGVHIMVFMDRVNSFVAPPRVPYLLGHVMAHEVSHIMQGVIRHSDSGVMKACWDEKDYRRMMRQTLDFAPEDIALIRRGLQGRAAFQSAKLTAAAAFRP